MCSCILLDSPEVSGLAMLSFRNSAHELAIGFIPA
jgi:hypothetical protein